MVPSAAENYAATVDAYNAQQARMKRPPGDRWAASAALFRLDPRRTLEPNTAAVASLVGPDDVVIDVGGGAGRVSLPIALACKQVINIEPSAAMRDQFAQSAADAGIANAGCIDGNWPAAAASVDGDVVMLANVTYFVRDIVPFVQALDRAARKRVIIAVWSVPPPNEASSLFALLHGEPQALVPGHRELLTVLWDLGLLPEVRILPDSFRTSRSRPPTVDDAIAFALRAANAESLPGAAETVKARFDELFTTIPGGFAPAWAPYSREMLITWTKPG
jgi:hypothetical protein